MIVNVPDLRDQVTSVLEREIANVIRAAICPMVDVICFGERFQSTMIFFPFRFRLRPVPERSASNLLAEFVGWLLNRG